MLSRLSIRKKLLLTIVLPLLAIVILVGFAYPTFQEVKVNGPQYKKIRDAKDLEADILPPPAFAVEAYLNARLLLDARTVGDVESRVAENKRLKTQFGERHNVWQSTLGANAEIRSTMGEAWTYGKKLFAAMDTDFIPAMQKATDPNSGVDQTQSRATAQQVFDQVLTPAYLSHKQAIDASVTLSRAQQVKLERDTSSLLRNRFSLLGGAALVVFALIALIGAAVTRSINRPIRLLTDSANATAKVELPLTVERIQSGEVDLDDHIANSPLAANRDELGELARAFDAMHDTAISLAANQAKIRRNVSDNLVNIGRRNQSLLKRTLGLITQMEQDERDSSKLEQMFRLDHLTTRMRRNAESLLVLAGGEPPVVRAKATDIAGVIRAALSQVEAYDRVDFGRVDEARIKGQAIGDVAHMIAELLENATYFSPPTTRVTIHGKQRLDGYLLVIVDDGVGMSADELEAANQKIANPQAFDQEPSKVLGHVVVGRLGQRYGIKIRLAESATAGVAAQIFIPPNVLDSDELVERANRQKAPVSANGLPQRQPQERSSSAEGPVSAPTYSPVENRPQETLPTRLESAAQPSSAPLARTQPAQAQSHFAQSQPQPQPQPQPYPQQSAHVPTPTMDTAPLPSRAKTVSQKPIPVPSSADIPTADLQPRVTKTGESRQLVQRVRGAQLPDTGPAAPQPIALEPRSAERVRGTLGALQRGSTLGRSAAPGTTTGPAQSPLSPQAHLRPQAPTHLQAPSHSAPSSAAAPAPAVDTEEFSS